MNFYEIFIIRFTINKLFSSSISQKLLQTGKDPFEEQFQNTEKFKLILF